MRISDWSSDVCSSDLNIDIASMRWSFSFGALRALGGSAFHAMMPIKDETRNYMLDTILHRVRAHSPPILEPAVRLTDAAVFLPITLSESPVLVLPLLAAGLSTTVGEVAFPRRPLHAEDRHILHP